MANHKSAAKASRRAEARRVRNMHYKRTMRNKVKAVREAVASSDVSAAREALADATQYIGRCATKGVIHKRTASRKISRLTLAVNAVAA